LFLNLKNKAVKRMKEFGILKETFIYNCENVGIKAIPNAVILGI
jgi:hypothetical protein